MKDLTQFVTTLMKIMMSFPAEWTAISIIKAITKLSETSETLQKIFQLIIAAHKLIEIYVVDIHVTNIHFKVVEDV